MRLDGIHHITVLASDPQRNVAFYTDVLGQRLVKRTVNFDAPDVYHLYYGDDGGQPGTLMTFFPFPDAARGKRGTGEVSAVAYHAPASSIEYWVHRLSAFGIAIDGPFNRAGEEALAFHDPDGLLLELVFSDHGLPVVPWSRGPVGAVHALRGFHGVTLTLASADASYRMLTETLSGSSATLPPSGRQRVTIDNGLERAVVDIIVDPSMPRARQSAGSVHHIAWRVRSDAAQVSWRERLIAGGVNVTEIVDRNYFHSIYFREPGGVLYEIATDPPGMTVDEDLASLGTTLRLPPWYEPDQERIHRILPPITVGTPYLSSVGGAY